MKNFKITGLAILTIVAILFIGVGIDFALAGLIDPSLVLLAPAAAMTLLEITDAKTVLLDANDAIFEKAGTEKRELTTQELEQVETNNRKLEQLALREVSQRHKEMTTPGEPLQKRQAKVKDKAPAFSMIGAINDVIQRREIPSHVRDMYNIGSKEIRSAGQSTTGEIILPSEIRADLLAGAAGSGQEIVSEQKMSIIPPLTDRLVLVQAGAKFLPGLKGNVSIPSYAGTTVQWKSEVASAEDGAGATGEVLLAPKRLTAYLDISKLFLNQDGVGAENMLMENIALAVALKLQATILGTGTVHADYPSGIGYKLNALNDTGVASIVPTWAKMVDMETRVDTGNALAGNLAYITNSAGRGLLKSTPKGTNSDDIMLMSGNEMNGYPVLVTNSAPSNAGAADDGNLIAFANWADLIIGQWAGYDITVDPYTLAKDAKIRLVINAWFDAKGLRGATGTGATLDEYAVSFAAEAIKSA